MKRIISISLFIYFGFLFVSCSSKETIKIQKYHKGFRYDKDGWIYVHIEGEPYERGFQHGYLIADVYEKAFKCYSDITFETSGFPLDFFISRAVKMQKSKIPEELLEEMKGIAAGISARGSLTTLDEIIGWNAFIEITESWWGDAKSDYAAYLPAVNKKERCSAFIATGSATKDKKIVIAHSSFDNFWNVQWANVILDIKPKNGHKIMMQTTPGYVASMTDFFIMDSGLVGLETTLAGFSGFEEKKTPSYVSARMAMQYANTIDEFIEILNKDNNGGNPASWLIGDIKTNEIAKYEQGLKFQNFQKKKDGYFFGANVAIDPSIRNLECDGQGYNDIRRHTGGRRVRLIELLEKFNGKINAKIAKKIMSDHYDVYDRKNTPHANTICAHYDEDPRVSMSSPSATHPDPYTPAGAIDCMITTTELAKNMKLIGRFGRPCGKSFNADKFLRKHPQWNWQKGYLLDRPSQPWCDFTSYK
ncbi:MAG: C45 family peptidase [Parachlamydiales bacterium]|jgi:hypothetical protein